MKKENLMTPAELSVLLAENGEDSLEFDADEPLGERHVNALQKAVRLLARQVADLQAQLHEHLELHDKQQDQMLRQMKYQMENKLYEQIVHRVTARQDVPVAVERIELKEAQEASSNMLTLYSEGPAQAEEPQPMYSRVKSYRKIRKRKKGFLERLFE
ncbi:hypothetical protein [Paenibacillus aceris]|uniref:Regulator of replication initiation timing n=1 Tax=Paenibacillus aceris TaxID=869555 RepID=A0ABS4I2K3_9BACL|nr:hypothetical protein [Paenibacillus aceris]MBP1965133.1 regulator of replication initiation timing [Paenibacillus aceris]NHW33114.1 hypothetical protein [Paenibacillus aceris]